METEHITRILEGELSACAEYDFVTSRLVDPFTCRIRSERSDSRRGAVYRIAGSLGVVLREYDECKDDVRRSVASVVEHMEGVG